MNEIPRSLEYEEEQALDSQRVIPGGGDAFATVESEIRTRGPARERSRVILLSRDRKCFAMASPGAGSNQSGPSAAAGVAAAVSARTGAPVEKLSIEERADARRAADLIADSHRGYFSAFNSLTAEAQEIFEKRAWIQAALNAERRVRLYRTAVDDTWQKMQRLFPERLLDRQFWMAARRAFLERVFNDYEADLALTFFYSIMRLAFDQNDTPVEYADDGLAEHSHIWNPHDSLGNLRSHSETDEPLGDPHSAELRIPGAL